MTARLYPWLALCIAAAAIGCSGGNKPAPSSSSTAATHEEHEHPAAGPHGGDLIELGNEEFHAEVTHENEVTVYLLDSQAKAAAPVDAAEATINITHDGKAEQFRLAANRDASDPEGKASRFSSKEAELLNDLQGGEAAAQLTIVINGKQYRGELEHDHDHEGHQH